MNNKINYQKTLDETIKEISQRDERPRLLLHSCCAPCSSYVLEYLSGIFDITVYFYNPNIAPYSEYEARLKQQIEFINNLKSENEIKFIEEEYDNKEFEEIAVGLENLTEGGERCNKCFRLRLEKTANYAKLNNIEYFTTTLTVSPHKNSRVINEIGGEISKEIGVKYLFSDFKKKEGYKRSIQLSNIYNLYRQEYCGCLYSKKL